MLALPTTSSGERRIHSSEWEGTQTPGRERHAHRWPSMVRGGSASLTSKELWKAENSFLRMRGNLDAQKGAACSLVTLYGEGSKASSTNKESDLSQSSGGRRTHSSEWEGTQTLRRERHAHRWPSKVRGAMLALPATSSGERRTHSSEWEGTHTLRREQHAHRWPSIVRGAMLARPTRSAPSLDLVSTSEVITAIAFRNGSYSSIGSCTGSFHLTLVRWSLRWLQGN